MLSLQVMQVMEHQKLMIGCTYIKEFYKSHDGVPRFTNAQIVSYFVTQQVCDSHLCGNFKAINTSAMNLYHRGHLQQEEVFNTSETLWLHAYCLPEVKKDTSYKVELSISHSIHC